MSAVVSVITRDIQRKPGFYHAALQHFRSLLHVTIEVNPARVAA
jgi:hypothetical protein